MQPLVYGAGVVEPALGAAPGLGRWFVGGCGFAECWSFPDVEAPFGNHSAQSPASVQMASPGHAMGHCKVKCSMCSMQQVWWYLHWVLRPG